MRVECLRCRWRRGVRRRNSCQRTMISRRTPSVLLYVCVECVDRWVFVVFKVIIVVLGYVCFHLVSVGVEC